MIPSAPRTSICKRICKRTKRNRFGVLNPYRRLCLEEAQILSLNRCFDLFVDIPAALILLDGHQEQRPAIAAIAPYFSKNLLFLGIVIGSVVVALLQLRFQVVAFTAW